MILAFMLHGSALQWEARHSIGLIEAYEPVTAWHLAGKTVQ